jgi:predicted RecA/RadA family phage recombinase
MRSFRKDGARQRHTASGADISSGDAVVVGNRVYFATADIEDGSTGELCTEGVVEYDKVSAQAWVKGDEIFYDSSADKLTTVGAGNVRAGYADEAAANPSSSGKVKLSGSPKRATNVAANATANGSDAATTQALANSLKTSVNDILTALKDAGIMKNS